MVLRLWCALMCCLALAAGVARADDLEKMQGNWVASAKVGKKKGKLPITIQGDKFTLQGAKTESAHFTLNEAKHEIDFFKTNDKKERVWHGIYEFSGEELKMCWGPADRARPKGFTSNDKNKQRYYKLTR
jgi:uncharacterized protein (TIGR03067 family)